MTTPRKLLVAVLALPLLAAACGDDDDSGGGEATNQPVATADPNAGSETTGQAVETAATETAAEVTSPSETTVGTSEGTQPAGGACDQGDPMPVGASLSISGPAADIGDLANDGAEMALEDINASGGILGRCAELSLKDDGGDPTKAAQVFRELVDQEQVAFVVGPFLSSPIGAAIEITNQAQVPHVVAGVLPDAGDATKFPYVFRTEVVATLQAQTFVEYMQAQGLTTAAALAVNNALGTSNVDGFNAAIEGTAVQLLATEFHESGSTDLTAQVRALMDTGAEVMLLFNTAGPDQVAAINARNSVGWDVPVLGFSSAANRSVVDGVGESGMNDVFAGQAYRLLAREEGTSGPTGDKAVEFLARYKDHTGQDPLEVNIQQAAGIYDSFMMMAEAINDVGDVDPEGIKEYLETNGYDGVKATYEYDAERHDGVGLDDLVFVTAASFEDGTLALAPGQ